MTFFTQRLELVATELYIHTPNVKSFGMKALACYNDLDEVACKTPKIFMDRGVNYIIL